MKTFSISLATLLLSASIATAQIIPRRGFSLGIPPLFAQAAIGLEVPKEDTPKEESEEEEGPSTLDKVVETTEKVVDKTVELGKEYFEGNTLLLGISLPEVNLKYTSKNNQTGNPEQVDFPFDDGFSPYISLEIAPSLFSDDLKWLGYRFKLSTRKFDLGNPNIPMGFDINFIKGEYLFLVAEIFGILGSKNYHLTTGFGGGIGFIGVEGTIGIFDGLVDFASFEHKFSEEALFVSSFFIEIKLSSFKFILFQSAGVTFDTFSPSTGEKIVRIRIEDRNIVIAYAINF